MNKKEKVEEKLVSNVQEPKGRRKTKVPEILPLPK